MPPSSPLSRPALPARTASVLDTLAAAWAGRADFAPWLHSLKVFGAAMLALYVALALGLPRPYWAMATVYLVSSPLAGATYAKGTYRVFGTLLGACARWRWCPGWSTSPCC
ncbi:hypothetical protein AU476_05640 [Cupriavidus sp. UYMSc13B]|nr:hypothetical protein AU476_05640 [Cupriavidus sp. UYMSc13B]